jgi:glycosyltransferase involved in cell wall biosynthesis
MKIALVAPTHLPARRANTIQVMKMAQAFTRLGHTVQVVVPGVPSQPVPWDELAHSYGLKDRFPVTWLPAFPALRRYDYGLRAVQWARAWKVDLLYTRLPQAAALASSLGVKTILEMHDLPGSGAYPWLFQRFLKGRGARRLVAITQALASDLAEAYRAPLDPLFTCIAPDGVDLDRFLDLPEPEAARRGISIPPPSFTVGYTGHLYSGRGVEMILDLARELPEMSFLLAGGEPQDVQRLKQAAQSAGLENVILPGFIPNAELPLYQAASDVLLMPYQRHVAASSGGDIARYLSPLKLFEYMACGRAILCSNLPVLREVLNPHNAVLLPSEDVQAWISALRQLQADPQRRRSLGGQARQDSAHFTWENRAQRILEGLDLQP